MKKAILGAILVAGTSYGSLFNFQESGINNKNESIDL